MRKAKLDILETIPDLDISAGVIPEVDRGQDIKAPPRWAFNKLMMIGLPVLAALVLIAAAVVYLLFSGPTTKREAIVQHPATPSAEVGLAGSSSVSGETSSLDEPRGAARDNMVHIREFIIDLQDSAGKGRVLLCDVALDLEPGSDIQSLGPITDIRKVIYWTAQSRDAAALRSVAERRRLKEDLTRELQKLPAGKTIKNVYFTNYLIL